MIKFGMLGLSLYNTYIVILDIYSYFRGLSFNYADPTEGFYMLEKEGETGRGDRYDWNHMVFFIPILTTKLFTAVPS